MKDINKDLKLLQRYTENNKIRKNCQYWYNIDQCDQIYLKQRFDNISDAKPSEYFYLLLHKLEQRPKCIICGKSIILSRFSLGYQKYCSNECRYSEQGRSKIAQQLKDTCIEKYGVENVMKINSIKQKSINNSQKTMLQRYNVKYNFQIPEVREKIKKKVKEKTGYEYAFNNKDKVKNTCIEKYGVENVFQTDFVKNKINDSKRQHHTFSTSKHEIDLYNFLIQKYGENNIIRQYKTEEYPFNCDFYIKSYKLYIELQKSWTHGTHPYNKNNKEDQKKLLLWIDKSKNSEYYKQAIEVWTIRDVKKRNIAKQNKIKYLEIFDNSNIKEIYDSIESFK